MASTLCQRPASRKSPFPSFAAGGRSRSPLAVSAHATQPSPREKRLSWRSKSPSLLVPMLWARCESGMSRAISSQYNPTPAATVSQLASKRRSPTLPRITLPAPPRRSYPSRASRACSRRRDAPLLVTRQNALSSPPPYRPRRLLCSHQYSPSPSSVRRGAPVELWPRSILARIVRRHAVSAQKHEVYRARVLRKPIAYRIFVAIATAVVSVAIVVVFTW